MGDVIRDFKDLRVWQKGVDLVKFVYELTKKFPKEEQYGLSTQIRRAAVSIPANIAEEFRRKYVKEYRQFLSIALGSSAELETLLVISRELGYIDNVQEDMARRLLNHICGMTVNLSKNFNSSF
jgi:four helix bundle protein